MPTVPDFERQQLHQYKLMAGGQCTYVHVVVERIPQLLQQSGRPADHVSPRRTSCCQLHVCHMVPCPLFLC